MPNTTSVLNINLLSSTDLITMSNEDVLAYRIMVKAKVLAIHKAPIKQGKGKDKRWYTYVPDATNKYGRKLIRKPTKEEVIDELVKFYTNQEESAKNKRKRFPENITVAEFFPHWIEYKKKNPRLSTDTIKKYKTAFTNLLSILSSVK